MFPVHSRRFGGLCLLLACGFRLHGANGGLVDAGPFKVRPEFQIERMGDIGAAFSRDEQDELSGLFGVKFAFAGKDVRALTAGPDGRYYFFCGDEGVLIPRAGNEALRIPEGGAILRSEPDGSHAEIYCQGVRDPQALAFDNLGNLFTADTGPGPEDQGRWLYLIEHGDYGWRPDWPLAAPRSVRAEVLAERGWCARFVGDAAWMLPPVAAVPPGVWGVAHYPGTGFEARYDDHFFVSSPARINVGFWTMRANGARFLLLDNEVAFQGAEVREMAFRHGAGLDFIVHESASAGTPAGLYALVSAAAIPDPRAEEAVRLLGGELKQKGAIELRGLLKHPDQRVRLRAEWALATVPDGEIFLREVAQGPYGGPEPSIARLHGIWGLGIVARRAEEKAPGAGAKIVEPLVRLLEDDDLEVRCQAASVLGELRVSAAYEGLIRMLRSPEERVSLFAAQALAKLGNRDALPQLILMLKENGDHDPNLRQAYVQALLGLRDFASLEQAAQNETATVRMGALLAMRQLGREEITRFLHDEEPALVTEAARAIYDENIRGALPPLAALIEHPVADDALMWRVLNANFQIGEATQARALADYAAAESEPATLRKDALTMLSRWGHPPEFDFVTGAPESSAARESAPARAALEAAWAKLQASKEPEVLAAATAAREALKAAGN